MAKLWMRTIDSAQREVSVEDSKHFAEENLLKVTFHIQGVTLETSRGSDIVTWVDMVEEGTRHQDEKPLTILQRLFRKESKVGTLQIDDNILRVTWWTPTGLQLMFDLNQQDDVNLWRECEIMTLSAGFHFRQLNDYQREYKTEVF